jgi:hypothetical protein
MKKLSEEAEKVFISSLESEFPRDDYRELVELSLMVLGSHPNAENYTFKFPGANHRARWMARIIYCLKMYLFSEELDMSPDTKSQFKRITLFFVLIYGKNWTQASNTLDAATNDLLLVKQLDE